MEGGRKHYHDGGRSSNLSVVRKLLAKKTSFFDLKFYILAGICVGCLITIVLLTILWFFCNRSSRKRRLHVNHTSCLVRMIQEEITEMKASNRAEKEEITDSEKTDKDEKGFSGADASKVSVIENRSAESNLSGESKSSASVISAEVPYIGWGRWYSLKELEIATVGFSEESVIGEGGYGIVYRGVLADGSVVAVKNLFNNKGQAEKEFQVEVEAIGKVRHKNLVGLIGYCVEGVQRMLVYEYVDNGNLEHWLHGNVGPVSPLTWDVRMKIAVGTAKGLAYLHEGLEPKVVHRDIKSSNILLDKKWNPKVSDFGLAKLLGSDTSHVTTRVMGTFGYVAPEYASSGKLNEGSDVYSFGILLMEIISGRNPVDYTRPAGEVNLVEWFKVKIASRCGEELVDPLIEVQPSPRALKRVLLVCLRCIHVDAGERPNMGQVVHMLEAEEAPFRGERWLARDRGSLPLHAGPVFYGETPFLSRRSSQEGK